LLKNKRIRYFKVWYNFTMHSKDSLRWVAGIATPSKTYITRVFNLGTWEEWKSMKRDFSSSQIREAVRHPLRGQWTPRGKALAETLFECRLPDETLISFDAETAS